MKYLFLALILITQTVWASPHNVYPKDKFDKRYIDVNVTGEYVSFTYCNPECDQQIGPLAKYLITDLNSQRVTEEWQVFWASLADLGILVVTILGGEVIIAAGITYGTISLGGVQALLAGGGLGLLGWGAITKMFDPVNPFEQYDQAQTIRETVLADIDIQVKDIQKFTERLDLVLEKISE